jgi:hypothetical protein
VDEVMTKKESCKINGLKGAASVFIDLTGKQLGLWTVVRLHSRGTIVLPVKWLCRCACGTERVVTKKSLAVSRSCGCVKMGLRKRPYESLYNTFEAQRKHDSNISYEDFVEFTKESGCHYCNFPIRWAKYNTNKNGNAYNLDRKNNSLGYSVENCVVCCGRCNEAKSNHFTYAEWVQIGELIKSWHI